MEAGSRFRASPIGLLGRRRPRHGREEQAELRAPTTAARTALGRLSYVLATRRLGDKQRRELRFWRRELARIVAWYAGRLPTLWDVPSPHVETPPRDVDLAAAAVGTWFETCKPTYYPRHLLLEPDAFAGMRVLDVGCGPIPFALAFEDCEVVALDPLLSYFRRLGFPTGIYPERLALVSAPAERMPFGSHSFDAVISVNALDHVDDFAAAAAEIERVLKPGGTVRFEIHYHAPTPLEPWALDDSVVLRSFSRLRLRKVCEQALEAWGSEGGGYGTRDSSERLTVWASDDRG